MIDFEANIIPITIVVISYLILVGLLVRNLQLRKFSPKQKVAVLSISVVHAIALLLTTLGMISCSGLGCIGLAPLLPFLEPLFFALFILNLIAFFKKSPMSSAVFGWSIAIGIVIPMLRMASTIFNLL